MLKNPYEIEKSLSKNYVKNGTQDYTAQTQQALLNNRDVIFPDFPVLVNDQGLTVYSNSVLYFPKRQSWF